MAYLRIHCDVCGGTWEVYHRDNWKDDKARQCPHCYSEIDKQVWNKEVLPAFGAVQDANEELFKDSTGARHPLFTVDFIADHLYKNRNEKRPTNCPVLEEFEGFLESNDFEGLAELEEMLENDEFFN